MNKYKITEVSGKSAYYYKKCSVCKTEIFPERVRYWVDSETYWDHAVCCSEECVNMLIFQTMDDKPISGFYIDRKIIKDMVEICLNE